MLSGFLITGILLETKNAANYFSVFYAHRALRILPVYWLLLIIWTIIVPIWFPQLRDSVSGGRTWLWPHWAFLTSSLFVQYFMVPGWRFEYLVPLAPNWSLAVEEQFYVVWSLLVRFFSIRALLIMAVAVWLLAIGMRLYWVQDAPAYFRDALYTFTPTRTDGLCAGVIARILYNRADAHTYLRAFAQTWWIWLIALAAVVAFDTIRHPEAELAYAPMMARVGWAINAVLFSAIILRVVLHDGWMRRVLEVRPLKHLGDFSYFIYLFHITIGMAVSWVLRDRIDLGIYGKIAAQSAMTVGVAYLSWWYFETPIRSLKRYFVPEATKSANSPSFVRS